jgi:hypothetical protein
MVWVDFEIGSSFVCVSDGKQEIIVSPEEVKMLIERLNEIMQVINESRAKP